MTIVTDQMDQPLGEVSKGSIMGRSTAISAALHSAILLFALVAFPAAKMDPRR